MLNYFFKGSTERQILLSLSRRQLQWHLFLRILVLSLLLGVNILLQSSSKDIIIPPLPYVSYFIAGVYIFTIASAFMLRRLAVFLHFAFFQISIDAVLATVLIYFSGGSQSIFVTLYFFPIITGSYLLLRKGGLAIASACTIGYAIIVGLEYLGYHPAFFNQFWYRPITNLLTAANYFSVHGITFFLVAILSAILSERLRKTETALSRTSQDFDQLAALYKQIFDDINTGIITIDEHGNITSFNRATEKISGFQAAEILGHSLHNKLRGIELIQKDNMRPITNLTRKDGKKIPIGYSWAALHTQDGTDKSMVITLQDLSEIKKMEDQVRQSEKMAALGEMAAGIAHEFRNPLAAISGSAQMLARELQDNHIQSHLMKIIVRECTRLEASISDFLQFSKPAVPEKEWLPLTNLTDSAVQLLRQTPTWNEHCRVITEMKAEMGCWGDPQQLKRVLINLIHNAITAFDGKEGEIRISASELTAESGGEKTLIMVSDNGPGIAPDIRDKIFDPFFTTRDSGTGLGLAIVHQIIDSHGGTIRVASSGAEDTCFEITLPCP